MNISEIILIIVGLALFEIISSIDNAVVNAEVLSTMSAKGRRWFLLYGLFFAVFVVRGLLPLLIVWASVPSLGLAGSFMAAFSSDALVQDTIEASAPILLAGGGIYLIYLFLHWLFVEDKEYAFFLEKRIHHHFSFWFHTASSIVLLGIVWITVPLNPLIAIGAVVGSTAFFITNGFKSNAEEKEQELMHSHASTISKIIYLELIDATFSIDGVLGAFAFTTAVPLILIGNGLGALIVRSITIHGTETVKKYRYLKNGAMYSIGLLGGIMVLEAIGRHPALWIPPLTTVLVVGLFFWLSHREMEMKGATKKPRK